MNNFECEKLGVVSGGQDGAICNGYLFRLNTNGLCIVTKLEDLTKVSEFTLDKSYVIVPHSNSVCFGNEYVCNCTL